MSRVSRSVGDVFSNIRIRFGVRGVHKGRPFYFSSKGGGVARFFRKKGTFRDLFFEPKIQTFSVKVFTR